METEEQKQDQGQEKRKGLPLFQFAYIKDFPTVLDQLRKLSVPETWEYTKTPFDKPLPILYNYIHHTFIRVEEERKIHFQNNYACFNTGLITPNQQEIFMFFKKFPDADRHTFIEFCKESDPNIARFPTLPGRAKYFSDVSELFFDYNLEIQVNIDHILDDPENFERFPENIQKLPKLQIINTFNGAIAHAIKRVERNYKTAIPQYYRGHLQLLLPLCFQDYKVADLALAIYKDGKYYRGRTCLTLDMAINNARLITKPDDEWLKP